MVININPADSNDLLEEGGQPNQDHGNLLKGIDKKTAKTYAFRGKHNLFTLGQANKDLRLF